MSEQLLLDTNILIWTLSASYKISKAARRAMSSSNSALAVSTISIWEIVLKHQAGKLTLPATLEEVVDQVLFHSPWIILPLRPEHLLSLTSLPMLHKDPFDRLLISQARYERMAILTADENIREYDVQVIW